MSALDVAEALIVGALMGHVRAKEASALIRSRHAMGLEINLEDVVALLDKADEKERELLRRVQ